MGQQQPQRQPQQQFQQQQPRQPQQQFQQQQPQRQPQQQFQQQQPQRQPPSTAPNKQLSLFEQIKQRINREKQLKNQIVEKQIEKERQEQRQQQQPQPQQTFRQPQPQQNFRQPQPQQSFQQSLGSFGVFEAVDLSGPSASPLPPPTPARNLGSRQAQNEGFFGVFPEVNLQ